MKSQHGGRNQRQYLIELTWFSPHPPFCRSFDLKEALNAIGIRTCSEINESVTERGFPPLNKEVQTNLVGQLCNIVEEDNPINSLIG